MWRSLQLTGFPFMENFVYFEDYAMLKIVITNNKNDAIESK